MDAALFKRLRTGDERCRAALFIRHLRLAEAVARRYRELPPGPEDLRQAAALGLLLAIDGFDPLRGTAFSTYAVPVILREVIKALRDSMNVGGARRLLRERRAITDKVSALESAWGREPTIREVAQAAGRSAADVAVLMTAGGAIRGPVGWRNQEGRALEDVPDPSATRPFDAVDERLSLLLALERVPEADRRVVALRILGGLTQEETAKALEISQSQVSRRERRGLRLVWGDLGGRT